MLILNLGLLGIGYLIRRHVAVESHRSGRYLQARARLPSYFSGGGLSALNGQIRHSQVASVAGRELYFLQGNVMNLVRQHTLIRRSCNVSRYSWHVFTVR